ncbi:hypothetical protein [Comamonas thiooxydans]|uniref:hypothetical protein n=1 Tax=Comamonas thiooxydans TaxID=363952 RepID=UPI000B410447|nr:hypothetical protein [Comamonas thiooxydans]
MQVEDYTKLWAEVHPGMLAHMKDMHQLLAPHLPSQGLTITDPVIDTKGDEFRVTMDIKKGQHVVIGMDYCLVDAMYQEGGDDEYQEGLDLGVGVKLELIGYGGLAMGGYFPGNFTPEVWTADVQQILLRVEATPVNSLARYVVKKALKNDALRQSLEAANIL